MHVPKNDRHVDLFIIKLANMICQLVGHLDCVSQRMGFR